MIFCNEKCSNNYCTLKKIEISNSMCISEINKLKCLMEEYENKIKLISIQFVNINCELMKLKKKMDNKPKEGLRND